MISITSHIHTFFFSPSNFLTNVISPESIAKVKLEDLTFSAPRKTSCLQKQNASNSDIVVMYFIKTQSYSVLYCGSSNYKYAK